MRRTPWMLGLLCCVAACSRKSTSTEIVVEVWSDLTIPAELDRIHLDVTDASASSFVDFPLTASNEPGKDTLPVQYVLVGPDNANTQIDVKASGFLGTRAIVWQEAQLSFLPGQARVLTLYLGRDCSNRGCKPNYTCSAGSCDMPTAVTTESLPVYDPNHLPPPPDAGSRDTAQADAPIVGDVAEVEPKADLPLVAQASDSALDGLWDGQVERGSNVGGTGGTGGYIGSGGSTGSGGSGGSGGNHGSGGKVGTGGSDAGIGVNRDLPPVTPGTVTPPSMQTCGDGKQDPNEQCDDGNTVGFDGCSRTCQVEDGYICPEWGRPCTMIARCGDGLLTSTETCDDSNTRDGDGCSADCQVIEAGFECRVPGKPCTPKCGDGVIMRLETCDDGNGASGDGCSSTCQVEPAYDCPNPGKPCVMYACGNGKVERGELCDCGTDPNKLPTGCAAVNGLLYGDGKGCSKTCTLEPSCRDSSGRNRACDAACGDGHLDAGEECDDGNLADGDGCSSSCKAENGFTCTTVTKQDSSACQSGTGQCLELPIIYRDFQPENAGSGGHPDFYFLGTKAVGATSPTTICVPNSAGPARGNDSTSRCWDIAAPDLLNGKPEYNASRSDNTCACQFSDWSIGNTSHIPSGYTQTGNDSPLSDGNGGYLGGNVGVQVSVTGPSGTSSGALTGFTPSTPGGPIWKGTVPIVKDAASFKQWFSDDTTVNKRFTAALEMVSIGTNIYQYASKSHLASGGFFPLDTLNPSQATLCNLWPYWNHGSGSPIWSTCTGDQYLVPPRVMQSDCPNQNPLSLGCWIPSLAGVKHDSYFTDEVHYTFVYDKTAGLSLQFFGDDDLFIFINGKLVLDLGGVHQALPGKVTVSGDPGNATIIEGGCLDTAGNLPPPTQSSYSGGGCTPSNTTVPAPTSPEDFRQRVVSLGLTDGKRYEIAIFGADRHPPESNFLLTMNGSTYKSSSCVPRCGDGIVSAGEDCDCGDGSGSIPTGCSGPNDDNTYGGCTTKCHLGPSCGDGRANGPEQCDLGKDNGNSSLGKDGCNLGCMRPHYCGDGIVDGTLGEECDLGTNNGLAGMPCDGSCMVVVNR